MPLSDADLKSEEVQQMKSDWMEYFKRRLNAKASSKVKELDRGDCNPIQLLEVDDAEEWENHDQHYPEELGYQLPEGATSADDGNNHFQKANNCWLEVSGQIQGPFRAMDKAETPEGGKLN